MAYLNVAEIEAAIEALADAYPAHASRIELPHLSHEGRRITALRIGEAPAMPAALFLGGVHAREWVPPDLMISLAADLLEAYARGTGIRYGGRYFSAPEIAQLKSSIALYVVPCVNPDGRHYSQSSNFNWRKNRNPAHGNGASSCCGVDLNRNFPFLWDHLKKFAPDAPVNTSADPCDVDVFRGDAEGSEPETQNVIHLLDTCREIQWMIDVHSRMPEIYHVWGSDEVQTSDPAMSFLNPAYDSVRGRKGDTAYREYIPPVDLAAAKELAGAIHAAVKDVRGQDYPVKASYELYATSGASDDYTYSRHFLDPSKPKVFGFTIECGHDFQPPWPEAENVIRETSAGLVAFLVLAAAIVARRSARV